MHKEKYGIEISADFKFLLIFQLISPNFKYLQKDQFLSYRNASYIKRYSILTKKSMHANSSDLLKY